MSDVLEPGPLERILNRAFGVLVGLGGGLRHNYLLQVRGRKTGRVRSTPVNVLELRDRRFLVAGRGRTQWVRNAEAAGEIILRKGRTCGRFRILPVPREDKAAVLSAYLDRFRSTVQRYFPVPAGSGPAALDSLVDRYPVFQLRPSGQGVGDGDADPRGGRAVK